ncbi:hypothetical protein GCM10010912_66660 [Paenibacillus albidus]|uniref:Glycoside hydrolase n=1 Tax=Paenibacillus albidus TaxID=2041023 RepID=A0A917D6R5_9BACL|nr:glycosyl hydrolase [Paenibacillus albidus]GGG12906.1 hypothetical protein GCM10010912_66660 [Paenibacillus albidus]
MEKIWQELKLPSADYRPVPLWSWNDRLEPGELERQIEEMHRAGIGGFFMHARGGLQTPYMGEEWMEAIRTSITKSRELGMNAWFYDENGWPSGFGDGKVPAKGIAYQQKRMVVETAPFEREAEKVIAYYAADMMGYHLLNAGEVDRADLRICYEVNPYYTDTLSKEAVGEFIATTYEAYWQKFGEEFGAELRGIFTDEPQFARGGLPWSFELEAAFAARYGYDLKRVLPSLFFNEVNAAKARYDYWDCVTFLFTQAYAKQIGDWCADKGWAATGHVVDEQELMHQVTSVGDPLAFYEYLQIPGCDWLGRFVSIEAIVPKQVGSVARQLGKKRTITESYGCSGWNVSFADLKRIGEWQFVHGINLLCPHLQGYSLRGLRKRDYPPSLFYQQPWWGDYKGFNDYFARLSLLLAEGAGQAEVLLLHPVRSAWIAQCGEDSSAIVPYHEGFANLSRWLCQHFIEHDYGSESIIGSHGRVEGGRFVIGEAVYRTVIIPPSLTLDRRTVELLQEFVSQGGGLIACSPYPVLVNGEEDPLLQELLSCAVKPEGSRESLLAAVSALSAPCIRLSNAAGEAVVSDEINVRTLQLDDSFLYYLVHSGTESYPLLNVDLNRKGTVSLVNLETGEVERLGQGQVQEQSGSRLSLPLYPGQSYMLKLVPDAGEVTPAPQQPLSEVHAESGHLVNIELAPEWEIAAADLNSLTLDNARLRVAGGSWSEPQPVIFIQEQLLAYGRPVPIGLQFEFQVDFEVSSPRELYLVVERPGELVMELNGVPVAAADCGWWRDISFRTLDIGGLVTAGRNTLVLGMEFRSSPELSAKLARARQFEAEGNKLTIDQELESIYLLGSFGVESATPFTLGERSAVFTEGPFRLTEPPQRVRCGDLAQQGFPFFSGSLRLRQTLDLEAIPAMGAEWIYQAPPDAIVTKLIINGVEVRTFLWAPYHVDITRWLNCGSNVIELELTNSCRNLLGPHHHIKGEVYKVGPDSYKDTPGWTDKDLDRDTRVYQQRYAFVRFGLAASPLINGGESFTV